MLARGSELWVLAPLVAMSGSGLLSIVIRTPALLVLTLLSAVAFVFLLVFFRDPPRDVGKGAVSPADGRVLLADAEARKVSIFMSVRDVHVNRAPLAGVVTSVEYRSGSHVPAFSKESERNERVTMTIATEHGVMKLTQVAGIVARRIVPYVIEGDRVRRGQRIGIIRLGSRVEVELPPPCRLVVRVGDRVKAGVSTLAEVGH